MKTVITIYFSEKPCLNQIFSQIVVRKNKKFDRKFAIESDGIATLSMCSCAKTPVINSPQILRLLSS